MCSVTNIAEAKQQKLRDQAELKSVREMTEQCYRSIDYLNERERELVNRLGSNKPDGPEDAA